MKKFIMALVFIFLFGYNFSLSANSFLESSLKDGVGIRPLGMGGTFVAICDDGNSIFYNPAYLSDAKPQYIRAYMDMNTQFFVRDDFYSISIQQTGFGNFYRQDKNGNKTDITYFAFGAKGQNNVAWGLTYKNIAWEVNNAASRGFSMDCGIKTNFTDEISAGVLLQDIFKNSLPVASSLRIGVAYKPKIVANTVLGVDGEFRNLKSPNGADIYLHYGAETKLTDNLIVRGGWSKDKFSGGFTAETPYFTFEYAIIVNTDRENTQMFGFKLAENI